MDQRTFDEVVQRLQQMSGCHIYAINPETAAIESWWQMEGAHVVPDLIIRDDRLDEDIDKLAGQIMHWGRLLALAERVYDIRKREYVQWKAKRYLDAVTPPEAPEASPEASEVKLPPKPKGLPKTATDARKAEHAERTAAYEAAVKAAAEAKAKAPPAPKPWKKPTEAAISASYQTHEEYAEMNGRVEEALETFRTLENVMVAWRAKRDMLGLRKTTQLDREFPRQA